MECSALCKNGEKCKNKAKFGEFCGLHKECPICYVNKRMEKLKCGHEICCGCSKTWFKKSTTCPLCREVVKESQLLRADITDLALMMLILDPRASIEDRPPDVDPLSLGRLMTQLGMTL